MQSAEKKYAILFVDDEEKALKYFSRLFSDEFTILTASNTEIARSVLSEHHENISILITDQRMPEETGVKLLRYTKENYPNIIRLLTTAYSDLSDAIDAVNTGEILRYITKPWDIDLLRLELRHALRFFLLKYERDMLLKEKLNTLLRMAEINKARDLVIFSSSLNKISHPQEAVLDLLRQVPPSRRSATFDINSLDEWDLSKSQIFNTLELIKRTKDAFQSVDDYSLKKTSAESILKECCQKSGIALDITGPLPELEINAPLFEQMILQFVNLLKTLDPSDPVTVTAKAADSGVNMTLSSKNAGGNDLSILNIPPELLISFLICYHHGGTISIENDANAGVCFQLDFIPDNNAEKEKKDLDEDIDEVLSRFEFWI